MAKVRLKLEIVQDQFVIYDKEEKRADRKTYYFNKNHWEKVPLEIAYMALEAPDFLDVEFEEGEIKKKEKKKPKKKKVEEFDYQEVYSNLKDLNKRQQINILKNLDVKLKEIRKLNTEDKRIKKIIELRY